MLVAISGGRVRVAQAAVNAVMDRLAAVFGKSTKYIHGKAKGTDSFVDWWAKDRGYEVEAFPVDSKLDGHSDRAPKMRNHRMLDEQPNAVVAFPGGPGTRHMFDIARQARVTVYDVELEDGIFRIFQLGRSPKEKATLIAQGSY